MMKSIPRTLTRQKKALAKVIFNPSSGDPAQSDEELNTVLATLSALQFQPEVYRVRPNGHIPFVASRAAQRGVPYVLACGGDNTVDLVARGLVGTRSTLVVIPTGTRNNIAHSLNVPLDPAEATRLITTGQRTQVDMGRVHLVGRETYFLELATIGLGAAVFPAMDEAQKGNLGKIGDLLATFISHPPATFHLNLDHGKQKISLEALTLLVLNMPYLGANYQIASDVDFRDRLLDVFLYADLGKLDLLSYALQVAQGFTDDPRVKHVRVKHIEIETEPPMPIMLDGQVLSPNVLRRRSLRFDAAPHKLNVMIGAPG